MTAFVSNFNIPGGRCIANRPSSNCAIPLNGGLLLGSIGHGAGRGHGSLQLLAFADNRPEMPAAAIGDSKADYLRSV
jgi:hypothetical protein